MLEMRFHLRTFFIKYTTRYPSATTPVLIKQTIKPFTSTFPESIYIVKSPVKKAMIKFVTKFFKLTTPLRNVKEIIYMELYVTYLQLYHIIRR